MFWIPKSCHCHLQVLIFQVSAEEYFLVSFSYVYFLLWQLDKQSKLESYQVCFCLIPPCFNKIISDLYFCIPDELCYVNGCIRSDFQYCYPCFCFKSGRTKGDCGSRQQQMNSFRGRNGEMCAVDDVLKTTTNQTKHKMKETHPANQTNNILKCRI